MTDPQAAPVLVHHSAGLAVLTLNRPRVLNTLNREMIRLLRGVLAEALAAEDVRLVLIEGAGARGFCAGGDLKELTQAVRESRVHLADQFFREEYALDLQIHQAPKPVVVLAHGITMGGGMGLAAGADIVVATAATRMAMPETRIGFFPDVGATGWLFTKCPPGYPEYLALTGYELMGAECVRLGLATHLMAAERLPDLRLALETWAPQLPTERRRAAQILQTNLAAWAQPGPPPWPELDTFVQEHFAGKDSLQGIVATLTSCGPESGLCREVLQRLCERSPTALAVTLHLLRANQGRPLAEVYQREALAAHFLISHPDYLEGIRARIIDKDDQPRWQPPSIAALGDPGGRILSQCARLSGPGTIIYAKGEPMSYQTILYDYQDGIATITFNRPDKLNALNQEMLAEFKDALEQVRQDPEVRVLLLTGAGRAFIAGADISAFLQFGPLEARQFAAVAHNIGFTLEALEVPVIACVNGFALGGGLEMAMACDFIYAADTAKMGQPEINLGIIPGFGGTQRLSRLVGKGVAKEMVCTGRMVDAAEAKALGLAAQVFPADTFMDACRKVAQALAAKGRVSLRAAKQAIDRGFDLDLKNGCLLEVDAFALCFASPDAHEGAQAFLEKRAPQFA
jgi:enoyl-CoA hydratase/carnithine racemase